MSALPYIGSKISLVTDVGIRYEGILYTINTDESTIALQFVRSFGTENRRNIPIPGSSDVHEYLVFNGREIKDLNVLEEAPSQKIAYLQDPAIVSVGRTTQSAPKSSSSTTSQPAPGLSNSSTRQLQASSMKDNESKPYSVQRERNNFRDNNRGDTRPLNSSYTQQPRFDDQRRQFVPRNGERDFYNIRRNVQGNTGKGSLGFNGPRRSGGGLGSSPGGRTDNNNRGPRQQPHYDNGAPVGELAPNVNAEFKKELTEEFDFTSANAKFSKSETPKASATAEGSASIRDGYNKSRSFFDDISCDALDRMNQGNSNNSSNMPASGNQGRLAKNLLPQNEHYQVREKQKLLDKETFGASAVARPFSSNGRFRPSPQRSNFQRRQYNNRLSS